MARRVVVVGLHRGKMLVDPMDVIQEQGRAGRKGIDVKGDAYILVPKENWVELREKYKSSPPIISKMRVDDRDGIDNLVFHVASEVAEGNVTNAEGLAEWYDRSLAAFQGCDITKEEAQVILELLEKIRAIKSNGKFYEATGLGLISSWMYQNPYDVFAWYMNFSEVFKKEIRDDMALAWAFANCRMYDSGYVATDDSDLAIAFKVRCKRLGLEIYDTRAVSGAVFSACLGNKDFKSMVDENRVDLLRMDIERVVQTIALIDIKYAKWGMANAFDRVGVRLKYGVQNHLVDLCMLKEIGAARSEALYSAGIKNLADMIARRELAIKILGNTENAVRIYTEATTKTKGGR